MKYTKQDVVSTAKTIIAEMLSIEQNQIADNIYFTSDLDFDSFDAVKFMMKMEAHYHIDMKSQDFNSFRVMPLSSTLNVVCEKFCNYLNTKAQINKKSLQKQK